MPENSLNLLTYSEAADILKISENTLRIWVSRKRISHIKAGRCVRFTPQILGEFLRSHTVDSKVAG